jgi:hypothetical protein
MDAAVKEVLYASGWSAPDTDSFCLTGLLPRIIRASLLYFQELHLFLQRLAVAQPDQWEEVGKEYLSYHTRALFRIRKCAQTRNQMILQTYTYLRDAKAKSFVDIKLLGALALKWHGHSNSSPPKTPSNAKPPPATPQWTCSHCHTMDLHDGGACKCPARDLNTSKARRVAKEALKLIKTEPEALERLVAEELA